MTTCVDASVILRLFIQEPDSDRARQLWGRWEAAAEEIWAPTLIDYEVAATLRLQVFRRGMSPTQADETFEEFCMLPIHKEHDPLLLRRAIELAGQIGQPRSYDACYLAVAERHDCLLYTADRRLANASQGRVPWVRLLGEAGDAPSP